MNRPWKERLLERLVASQGFWVVTVTIIGVFYLLMIPPWVPQTIRYDTLDGSWIALYNEFAFGDLELSFGENHVFTMGPLAWLRLPFYYPGNLGFHLLWGAILATALTFSFARIFRRAPTWVRVVGFVVFLVLPILTGNRAGKLLTTIKALFVFDAAVSEGKDSRLPSLWDLLVASVLALSSLIVFTEFLTSVMTVVVMAAISVWKRRRLVHAAWLFPALVLLLWTVMGQSISVLPAYLKSSLIISAGYAEVMSRWGPWWEPAAAVAGFLLLGGTVAVQQRRRPVLALLLVLGMALLFYVSFKHGFVRHTRPRITLTGVTLVGMAVGYFGAVGGWNRRQAKLALVPLGLAILISVSFLGSGPFVFPRRSPLGWPGRQLEGIRDLNRDPHVYLRRHQKDLTRVREAHPLPALDGPVDMFGSGQGILLAHGLDLRPRPVFQSFAAFTPELAELNAAYYRGAEAPRWIIAGNLAFGGQLAASLDARAFLELFQRYELRQPLGKSASLLERVEARPFRRRLVLEREILVGEIVSLGSYARDSPLWVEIDLRATLDSVLFKLLFKPVPLSLRLGFLDGAVRSYALSPASAGGGFLLSPLLQSPGQQRAFFQGMSAVPPNRRVKTVAVVAQKQLRLFAPGRGTLRVYELSRPESEMSSK